MARLFVGQREISLIHDLTKEFVKDVCGMSIHYFPVSSIKSDIHAVYNESVQKIYENPIIIPALVGQPEYTSKTTAFGPDMEGTVEVLIQYRDLQDKEIVLSEGDFFSYDDVMYEITTVLNAGGYIFGMAEHSTYWKITGRLARYGQITAPNLPVPRLADDDAQRVFEQQRGLKMSNDGKTLNDTRHMRKRLENVMAPIALGTGPKRVEQGDDTDSNGDFIEGNEASSFNNDPPPPKKGVYDE